MESGWDCSLCGVKFDTHSYAECNLQFGYWLNLEIVTTSYMNYMVRILFVQLPTGITLFYVGRIVNVTTAKYNNKTITSTAMSMNN